MKKLSLILIGSMACLALGISTALGQTYSLTDLGLVKGMAASEAAAINNLGHVAGTAYKGPETCAFHYDPLKKFMEDAGGLNSRAFGISSTGMVVGDSFFPGPMEGGSHAAMFKGGFPVDLGVLKGQKFSRANGINAMGQVVGFSGPQRDGSDSRAFMWSGQTGMIDIGTLGGAYAQAYAINDAAVITGGSRTPALTEITHAFIYPLPHPPYPRYGGMVDLGVLGGDTSYGMAINDNNHVVGYSTFKANDERVHAFLHDGNRMIDLGSLGLKGTDTDVSGALGVNNLDQVVGYSYLPSQLVVQQVAFLWSRNSTANGTMVNLNKLLNETGKNYLLISATAINDKGQIVAIAYNINDGGNIRAVLLTPNCPNCQ